MKFELVAEPRICEILGVGIEQKFNIAGYLRNPCYIDDKGCLLDSRDYVPDGIYLLNIIKTPSLIEVIPEYNDEQWEVFKALRLLGCEYVALNSNRDIWAFDDKPVKKYNGWEGSIKIVRAIENTKTYNILKPLLSWEQSEPFKIPTME